jgi:hypothetical protein
MNMITGGFPDYLQEDYLENFNSANKVLKEYELLNNLFDEFKGYETKLYKKCNGQLDIQHCE